MQLLGNDFLPDPRLSSNQDRHGCPGDLAHEFVDGGHFFVGHNKARRFDWTRLSMVFFDRNPDRDNRVKAFVDDIVADLRPPPVELTAPKNGEEVHEEIRVTAALSRNRQRQGATHT